MKDLAFLMLALGLIMVAMMAAQSTYRGKEVEKNRKWNRDRYQGVSTPPRESESPPKAQQALEPSLERSAMPQQTQPSPQILETLTPSPSPVATP